MEANDKAGTTDRDLLSRVAYGLAAVAGLVLAAVVLLTVADVTLRFVATPIYGAQEITQAAMVAIIMLALPFCGTTRSNIRVDLFDRILGRAGRRLTNILSSVIALSVVGLLVWNTVRAVISNYKYGDATNLLSIPLWPLFLLIAIGMALFILVDLKQLVGMLKGRGNDIDV